MKKIFLVAVLALSTVAAHAQVTVQGSKFSDNISLTVKGGAVTPLHGHDYNDLNFRGLAGLELRKQLTPVFGLGIEGEWSFNTSSWSNLKSNTAVDHQYIGAFGTINLMNAIAGYKGSPRLFEIEAVAGTGWLHSYYSHFTAEDGNSWATKAGLNFNFNLGEAKAWTVAFKPAVIWNMNHNNIRPNVLGYAAGYSSHHAYLELEAGVTYHFTNSYGGHSFKTITPMDEELIAALNSEINSIRAQLANCNADTDALRKKLADLESKLADCLNKKPQVVEVVKNLDNVHYVFFNLASSTIQANQKPNIFMVAQQLKNDPNATVDVKGYASKDGSLEFNKKLAEKRAQAVKKALVKEGVAESRINAKGEGIGDMFSQNTWNRVAICTIDAK